MAIKSVDFYSFSIDWWHFNQLAYRIDNRRRKTIGHFLFSCVISYFCRIVLCFVWWNGHDEKWRHRRHRRSGGRNDVRQVIYPKSTVSPNCCPIVDFYVSLKCVGKKQKTEETTIHPLHQIGKNLSNYFSLWLCRLQYERIYSPNRLYLYLFRLINVCPKKNRSGTQMTTPI